MTSLLASSRLGGITESDCVDARAALCRLVETEADQRLGEAATAINYALLARFKGAALATLFFGSCLRSPIAGPVDDRLHDFYVVVDDVRAANDGPIATWGNRLLPPNVFRLEIASDWGVLRCQYGVVGLKQLRRAVSRAACDSYFWARLCQPTAVPFARGASMRQEISGFLQEAIATAAAATAPSFGRRFTSRELWQRVFIEGYGRELRPERAQRVASLHDLQAPRYTVATRFALEAAGFTVEQCDGDSYRLLDAPRRSRLADWSSRAGGKLRSALRLVKAAFTFDGGVDHLIAKIERHASMRLEVTAWQRRHPLFSGPLLAWRWWRRGMFH